MLILQNTDAQEAAIRSFRQVLIVTIILFGHWHSACHTGCPHVLCGQLSGHGSGNRISLPTQHELRAPLAVIQSKQEALLTKPQATIIDESEAIATSLGETKRLRQLTDDLLTIAKADSNTIEIELVDQPFERPLNHSCLLIKILLSVSRSPYNNATQGRSCTV